MKVFCILAFVLLSACSIQAGNSGSSASKSSAPSQSAEILAFYGDGLPLMPHSHIDTWGTATVSNRVDTDGSNYVHIRADKTSGSSGVKLNPDSTGPVNGTDFSRFTNGSLVLIIRLAAATAQLNIQLEPDYPGWNDLTPYGLVSDGQWHTVVIPVNQIVGYALEIPRLMGIHFDGTGVLEFDLKAAYFRGTSGSQTGSSSSSSSIPDLSGNIPQWFMDLGNPIISQKFTADPVFGFYNNRVYLYTSHDLDSQSSYVINDVSVFSSDDLVNWTDLGEPVSTVETVPWAFHTYAPSIVCRSNIYYMYFGNGGDNIGVVTSSSPKGPWTDPVGHAIITRNTPGASNLTYCFDPAVFVDDDGQGYMYFGGGGPGNARVIKLSADMLDTAGTALTIDAPRFFEASYMHKYNGKYYFSYSTDFSGAPNATIDYMISDNPMSNFVYKGTILDNPPVNYGNNNHASIGQIGTNWYIFYHDRTLATLEGASTAYHRSVCMDRLYYDTDGLIIRVVQTTNGVEKLKNMDPYSVVQAETMNRQYGYIKTLALSAGQIIVSNIINGSCIKYKSVDFDTGAVTFTAKVSAGSAGGRIDIWIDSPQGSGSKIGSLTFTNTSGWTNITTAVSNISGVHDLYLRFTVNVVNSFVIDYWQFGK